MTNQDIFKLFNIEDINDLPNAVMSLLGGDLELRNKVYHELIQLNNHDMSYDWFSIVYEEELAQRKKRKQDFTPNQIARLCSLLTGFPEGTVFEPTAGNGSMLIADWSERRKNTFPWEYRPSKNMIDCWELADRALPILLLNLSIRGMMGYVYHGDVLTMKIKQKYILLNKKDDPLAFSEIIKASINDEIVQKK